MVLWWIICAEWGVRIPNSCVLVGFSWPSFSSRSARGAWCQICMFEEPPFSLFPFSFTLSPFPFPFPLLLFLSLCFLFFVFSPFLPSPLLPTQRTLQQTPCNQHVFLDASCFRRFGPRTVEISLVLTVQSFVLLPSMPNQRKLYSRDDQFVKKTPQRRLALNKVENRLVESLDVQAVSPGGAVLSVQHGQYRGRRGRGPSLLFVFVEHDRDDLGMSTVRYKGSFPDIQPRRKGAHGKVGILVCRAERYHKIGLHQGELMERGRTGAQIHKHDIVLMDMQQEVTQLPEPRAVLVRGRSHQLVFVLHEQGMGGDQRQSPVCFRRDRKPQAGKLIQILLVTHVPELRGTQQIEHVPVSQVVGLQELPIVGRAIASALLSDGAMPHQR
mmetsp:Transcript_5900/g.14101  ORF Transcript_5900/g.14101 Transcript_5900/m.14101 type:complete len:384 (+) Transcript_5900:2279-3430(+)